jgi:hypothetical protein
VTSTVLWLLWGLMFALVEDRALIRRRPQDTLSAHFWR